MDFPHNPEYPYYLTEADLIELSEKCTKQDVPDWELFLSYAERSDLEPGEVAVIRRGRLRRLRPFRKESEHFCIFEYIYFARPDSNLNGNNVYSFRKELGRTLAREHPVAADDPVTDIRHIAQGCQGRLLAPGLAALDDGFPDHVIAA